MTSPWPETGFFRRDSWEFVGAIQCGWELFLAGFLDPLSVTSAGSAPDRLTSRRLAPAIGRFRLTSPFPPIAARNPIDYTAEGRPRFRPTKFLCYIPNPPGHFLAFKRKRPKRSHCCFWRRARGRRAAGERRASGGRAASSPRHIQTMGPHYIDIELLMASEMLPLSPKRFDTSRICQARRLSSQLI